MAKTVTKKARISKKVAESPFSIYWGPRNYFFLILGVLLLVLGFYVMSIGKWDDFLPLSISPIILLFVYLIIFPLSIFYRKDKNDTGKSQG